MKRISWDELFIGVAKLVAKRSRDENTQVGACIVRNNKILSTGYNGMPRTCDDFGLPTTRVGKWLETKYPYVVHAELNAILNAPTTDLSNCKIYVTLFPCCECAKAILQCGIKEIYYLENKYPNEDIYIASKKMLELSNIKLTQLKDISNEIKNI